MQSKTNIPIIYIFAPPSLALTVMHPYQELQKSSLTVICKASANASSVEIVTFSVPVHPSGHMSCQYWPPKLAAPS
jgi:hypothetical protein